MRWGFLAVGWISFGLGVVGVFLPLLPTTPFMILAAFCFSKGSPRLHAWLLSRPVVGETIRDWRSRRVIRLRAKLMATALLVPTVLTATVFSRWPIYVNGLLLAIVAGVLVFLWTTKSE